MISIDYTLIIVILNFILLLVILNKVLYKPLRGFLAERQKRISLDLEEAEKSKKKAEEMARNQEIEFKETAQEIRKMKELAKKDAEKQSDDIVKQARQREKDILIDTEKQLKSEKQKVIQAIESELSEVISVVTKKIVGQQIDLNIDSAMIEKLLSEKQET